MKSHEPDSVYRYAVTHVNSDGMRTLSSAAQGRYTYPTLDQAAEVLKEMLENNSATTLEEVFGHPSRGLLEVRPVECWPEHYDPKGIWFD